MVALAGSVNGLGGLLKKITVPVLVMHGDDDQIDPDVRRRIRNGRLPSSFVISRSTTLAAKSAPSRQVVSAREFDGPGKPSYVNPADVA